ncbi:MAG: response regulator [Mitsuaria chitosanitabida]|jgi:PAS domain S-box-containing protein|uniref:hybrid sensor histidine kinase/response regulator n=1 Tax=Roseateles chitosanitabidus TaxID=65048 RepID=UPI001AFFE69A|nr:ATP-binding protein [Roseateles chitosanitabidus]MBO9686645.1 response regulator [Roseateles chitosanitabidus]
MSKKVQSSGAGAHPALADGVAQVGAALDYASDAVILLRRDWTIAYINVAFERSCGQSREALLGRGYWAAFPHLRGTRFETEAQAAMTAGLARIYEEFSPRANRWYECRAYPCDTGLLILFIDVTMRKSDELTRVDLEEKLVRAQRMESLGTLAGGVAHDFNNILAAILGHAGMMLDALPADSPLCEHMRQIKRAGDRAREIVQRILAYARGGTNELSKHQLRPLVEDSIALLRSTLPATVRLTVDLSGDGCIATVNPSEVQQVVLNLCTNAWQAMVGGHGHLHVALRAVQFDVPHAFAIGRVAPTRYAELSVRDDGQGMPEEVVKRLFEPFFTTKPRGQGTGLGLHIVNGIVHAHGGAIDLQSVPGKGTLFSIYLPIVDEAASLDPAALVKVADPGDGEHLVYVDDDPIVLMMVEALLRKAGYDLRTYADPRACLDDIEAGRVTVQLLITDFSMPGMNGMELATAVRATLPRVPVIITTGYISDELTSEADRLGDVAVLQKERSFEELVELAARALRGFPETRFLDSGLAPL